MWIAWPNRFKLDQLKNFLPKIDFNPDLANTEAIIELNSEYGKLSPQSVRINKTTNPSLEGHYTKSKVRRC